MLKLVLDFNILCLGVYIVSIVLIFYASDQVILLSKYDNILPYIVLNYCIKSFNSQIIWMYYKG